MSAVVELGFSAPAVFTGIDRVEKRLSGLDQNVQKFGRRGGAGAGLGNVSMQLQDIAVQMQSGTRASIIFAQQGSQMLSAFGPAGAVAGAVAAIGGALYMGAEASKTSFASMMADMEAYRGTLARTLATIDVENVSGSIDTLTQKITAAQAEQAKLYTSGGQLFNLISETFMGDKSAEEKTRELAALQGELGMIYGDMVEQALASSAAQARAAALRAQGDDEAADAIERQMALKQKLAKIDAMPVPQYAKDQIKADLETLTAAEEKRDLLNAQKQLDEQRAKLAFEELDTQEQITELYSRLSAIRAEERQKEAEGTLDQRAALEIEGRRLDIQQQLTQLKSRATQEAERAAQTAKREADEAARANEQRKQAVMNTAQEFKLLEARATGRKRAIEDAEREVAIEQRRDRLMRDNGLNRAEATALATRMQNLQERADNGGRATRIRGVQNERRMSGLSDFYDLQRGPSAFDKLQQSESAFDKLQRTPSAFDQLQQRAAQDRLGPQNARNATEPTPSRPIDANEAVNRILTMLPQLMADALTKN